MWLLVRRCPTTARVMLKRRANWRASTAQALREDHVAPSRALCDYFEGHARAMRKLRVATAR
eukprot:15470242-Alexandrium_andersonii.AAC.1